MYLYYYGGFSGQLSTPSFIINTTNIVCYNRKNGGMEQTWRTVDYNNLYKKVLALGVTDGSSLFVLFLGSCMYSRVLH